MTGESSIILTGFADEISADFREQIAGALHNKLTHMEIRGIDGTSIADCGEDEVIRARELLDEAGVSVSTVASPIGKIGITDDFEPHFEVFTKMVRFAKLFRTPYIRLFSFYMPEGADKADYEDEVMRRLDRFADYAAKEDVILLHENEKKIFGDDADGCLKILKRFYGDHFKGIFDFANFVECGQDTLEAYEMLGDYIDYIHIKDAKKDTKAIMPAGMGDGNVEAILTKLKAAGYKGYLSLEPHLANFTGLAKLENAGEKTKAFADKPMAFSFAVRSLKSILWDIDWR